MPVDASNIEQKVNAIKDNPNVINLDALRTELNVFFKRNLAPAECIDVLYTKNTDKLFFGMCVMPYIDKDMVDNILITDNKIVINKYYLELDSKLFDKDLSAPEITALILHEIAHMVTNDKPVEQLRRVIDSYLLNSETILSLKDSAQYKQILILGMKDALIKFTSIFYRDEEIKADALVVAFGYGGELESALVKCTSNLPGLIKGVKDPKLTMLDWCFRLYKNVKYGRIPALHLLNKTKALTSSNLQKREMENVIRALNRIDTDMVTESSYITEAAKKNSLFSQLKYNGLRGIEEDYYEFLIRSKNSDTEDDAMYTLHQINMRMSILDDYITREELTDQERGKWVDLYEKYKELREYLSRKKIYNKKNYGLFFDYNQLDRGEE